MSIWGEVKKAINSTLGTNDFLPLDQYIKNCFNNNIFSNKVTFTESGTFTIPPGVSRIYVNACAGGGAGGKAVINSSATYPAGTEGGGGAGGDCVRMYEIDVTNITSLNLTVGSGGVPSSSGTAASRESSSTGTDYMGGTGTNTTIQNGSTTLLTLAGGEGGKCAWYTPSYSTVGDSTYIVTGGAANDNGNCGDGASGGYFQTSNGNGRAYYGTIFGTYMSAASGSIFVGALPYSGAGGGSYGSGGYFKYDSIYATSSSKSWGSTGTHNVPGYGGGGHGGALNTDDFQGQSGGNGIIEIYYGYSALTNNERSVQRGVSFKTSSYSYSYDPSEAIVSITLNNIDETDDAIILLNGIFTYAIYYETQGGYTTTDSVSIDVNLLTRAQIENGKFTLYCSSPTRYFLKSPYNSYSTPEILYTWNFSWQVIKI